MTRLGEVLTISSNKAIHVNNKNWLLNLDMVQQQTGEILAYNYVSADELCGSIIGFDKNVVLYSKLRPNLNKVVLPDKYGFCTSEFLPLLPDSKQLNREYLAWFLRSDSFVNWAVTKTAGAKMPRLGTKELLSKEIPLPDLPTQQRIADTLDKVSEGIGLCRKMLGELDLMVKAKFQEMFGDENYPHTELINLIKDGMGLSYGIVQPGDDGTGEMGVLRPVDMVGGKISMTSIKYIDRSIGDGFRKTELTGDELLITVRGTTGVTALTDARFTGMNVTRGIAVIRYDREKINPVYLNAYLNTDESQRYIQEHTRGATLQQINLSDLRIQDIVVPPINLQNRFAAFIAEVDKSKLTIQGICDKMEMEKLALMQEYFG